MQQKIRNNSKRIAAVAIVGLLYWLTRLPTISDAERAELAGRFRFERTMLPELPGSPKVKSTRVVHRDLSSFASWISSIGAAVALNDLDGDGLDNDLFHVDPRTDQVIVSPAPGTGSRYPAFELKPRELPYDSATMAPMGCVPIDANEDGLLDILVYYWGRSPVIFLRKAGAAAAPSADSFVAVEVAARVERWFTNAASFADIDGDTHADLIVGNYFPDGADILNADSTAPQHMQDSMSRAFNGGQTHVFLWKSATAGLEPGVAFSAVDGVLEDQVNHGWTLGIGAADLDGDGLPELYLANDFGPDRLLHNRSRIGQPAFALLRGVKHFTTPNSKVLGRDSYKGMSVEFGDVNGDGILDIYVSNIAKEFALEESHFLFQSTGEPSLMKAGIAPYRDNSESLGLSRSGWGWDTRLVDFDNDGQLEAVQATGFLKGNINRWPELHELAMANDYMVHVPSAWAHYQPGDDLSGHEHNPFFVRAADDRFYDIANDIGLSAPYVTRGIATADVDGDGRIDFAIANQWEPSFLFWNVSDTGHRSLTLRVQFPIDASIQSGSDVEAPRRTAPLGRAAIGASVTLTLPDGSRRVAMVDGGSGHSGKRGHEVHFGLGTIPEGAPLIVDVKWRERESVATQRFEVTSGRHTLFLNSAGKVGTGK
ncbi:MAG: CRTAC1 family protein [Phycisphaerae bacterium]|nr:CRTAC1 family protein [Phycisphaerae bacterium]